MGEFSEVYHHRLRYFLTPQFDMYRIIREFLKREDEEQEQEGRPRTILDYGCGNGVGSVLLLADPEWKVHGFDSDAGAIAFAHASWGHLAVFMKTDWAKPEGVLDVSWSRNYDAIVCLEVIEHVKDPLNLLISFERSLKPGGHLFVSTLNHNSQFRKNRGHIGQFCVADFRKLVGGIFPGVEIFEYTLTDELKNDDTRTPMVAVWRKAE